MDTACSRARWWSSLRVDGELSRVEATLLSRHLVWCPSCSKFDARISATTAFLRAAPAAAPPVVRVLAPAPAVEFPGRRRAMWAAVAVAVVAAAALGSFVGSLLERTEPPVTRSPEISMLSREVVDLHPIRVKPGTPPPKPSHLRRPSGIL